MAQKCRHEACDQFARKLTGAEIRNLEQFNLSKGSCKEILFGTIKGLCPSHAASELPKDFQLSQSLLRNIDSCWDVSNPRQLCRCLRLRGMFIVFKVSRQRS